MTVILGTGAYRYEVVDNWAKLPPGQEFNADVAAVTAAATAPGAAAGAQGAAVAAKLDGATVYASGCNVCHAAGVAGAPKFGDKSAWAPRLAQGIDGLTASVIKGKGAMPPRGAVPNASDAELRAAVTHMLAAAK